MQTMDVINQLNRLHEKYKRYIRMGIVTVIVFFMKGFVLIPAALLMRMNKTNTTFLDIILVVIVGHFVKQCFTCKKQYARIYKENFVTAVMNEMFSDVQVDWERGFRQKQVREMEIIDMGDEFASDMHLQGSYQGVRFEQSYVTVKSTDGDGDVQSSFYGYVYIIDTRKMEIAPVSVVTKVFRQPFKIPSHEKNMYEMVQMESVEFQKYFDVRTLVNRSIDAFYVLKPHTMERLLAMQKRRKEISMRFAGDKLYIACLAMQNVFDGNIRKPLVYTDEMNKIRDEFQDVKEIVELVS